MAVATAGIGSVHARWVSAGLAFLGVILVLGLWTAGFLWLGESRLPSPVTVAYRFFTTFTSSPEIKLQGGGSGGFLPHVIATAWHFLLGTLSGLAFAGVGLVLAARFRAFSATFEPFVAILRTIPPLALAPFLILWFGTATIGQVLLVAFYVFVMIYPPGVAALSRVEPSLIDFASTLGASRSVTAWEIMLPAVIPAIAGPLQVAVSWSWGLVVVAEILGARQGIGKLLAGFVPITATDLTMVAIVWILLMAIVSEAVLSLTLRRATRWMP